MTLDFLAPARTELEQAIDYYNAESPGLGFELAAEVRRVLDRIASYPEAWQPLSKRTRRCRTNRFPYAVIYQLRQDRILIVAVMHLRRHPRSWRSRLKGS